MCRAQSIPPSRTRLPQRRMVRPTPTGPRIVQIITPQMTIRNSSSLSKGDCVWRAICAILTLTTSESNSQKPNLATGDHGQTKEGGSTHPALAEDPQST